MRREVCAVFAAWLALAIGPGSGTARADAPAMAGEYLFVTEELPPFNYRDAADMVGGPAREVVTAVCRDLQVSCRIHLLPKKRMMALAMRGEVQGLFTLGRNRAREQWLYFSRPFVRTRYGFFVRATDRVRPVDVDGFIGFVIATFGPSNMLTTLRGLYELSGHRRARIVVENDLGTALRKLAAGRYGQVGAAVYANRDVGRYIITAEAIGGLRYALDERRLDYYVAFPKRAVAPAFVGRFDAALQALFHRGGLTAILERYGLNAPPDAAFD